MNPEMIIQKPAFNKKYFTIGKPLYVINNSTGRSYYGLVLKIEDDRMTIINVEWDSPLCGGTGYEIKTKYIYIEDVISREYVIQKL